MNFSSSIGNLKNTISGFTLVELIVVITILAILGTIGFVSIQGYSSSARNSSRVSNLVNLSNGLTLFREASGTLPLPESALTLTASGVVVGYQGFARDQVASIAKLSAGATRDPLDTGIYMTYATNALLTKVQVMAYMEDGAKIMGDNLVPGVSVAYAGASSNYTSRIPTSKGDTVGILLGNTGSLLNQPVQELVTGSFTGVDLAKTTTGSGYTIVFSKDDTTASIPTSGTGAYSGSLFTFVYNKRGDLIGNKLLASNDESLVGYWDMETLSGGLLKDLSRYGNDGTCYNSGSAVSCGGGSGGPQIVSGNGKSGKAMSFD
jgi:prepilin-type N-terminal cleavage/methylation domain-containing protein